MNRRRYGLMDGYQYIYCLPPAGGRIRSEGNKCAVGAIMNPSEGRVGGVRGGRGAGLAL